MIMRINAYWWFLLYASGKTMLNAIGEAVYNIFLKKLLQNCDTKMWL